MRVDILMVGKYTDKPYQALVEEYLGRCRGRFAASIVHCRDEAEMRRRIEGAERVVALDERGKVLDSMKFAGWISELLRSGLNRVTFCLGPSAGLAADIKAAAHEKLALSPLTLNHQLALLVLAEQLYRGLSILAGEPYHKA
ncbi:MAG TPA: 23S rRNA (pseudouridine(1915)-N(3))-methyltransferase RlmH [Candidatus Ozemobacteraceae bacterium]|nr:23S rRNA (pseudouridine(1915)-N(3))-methyltransferase RlmH [Candidatus Ozemobacteraceae bacterium]